jgi:type III secretion protein R
MTTGAILALAALAVLPLLLVSLTCFAKLAVVLAILRNAVGSPQVPPTLVLTGAALALSLVVMAPVAGAVWREAGAQVTAPDSTPASLVDAAARAREPIVAFLAKHAHPRDREVFTDLARRLAPADEVTDRDLRVLAPAFVTSELKEAFVIGFLLFLPFLVLDLLVAAVLSSIGFTQLQPSSVALPFKLLLFVAVDGWLIVARGLLLGYV